MLHHCAMQNFQKWAAMLLDPAEPHKEDTVRGEGKRAREFVAAAVPGMILSEGDGDMQETPYKPGTKHQAVSLAGSLDKGVHS